MSQNILDTADDSVADPDPNSPYDDLKEALILRHAPSKPSQMMAPMLVPPIAPGQDPMPLMDQIRALKFGNYDLEAGFFCAKMPEAVRRDLMKDVNNYKSVRDLAKAAKELSKKSGESIQSINPGHQSDSGRKASHGLCRFHRRYGERGWECQKPCSWSGRRPSGRPGHLRSNEDHSGNEDLPC